MNSIQNECLESKKYMLEIDDRVNSIVKITSQNVAKVEAMIKNDSAYLRSSDKLSKPIINKKENIKYQGSSSYWISQLKDIIINNCKESHDGYSYDKCLSEAINAIDRENSTHLNADGVGRKEIFDRISKIDKRKFIKSLKEPMNSNYDLIRIISEKTTKGRENFSFATKFCHYMCFYLFEGNKEQDNFSIYDGVLINSLPMYCKRYNIKFNKKETQKDYPKYINIIDKIREEAYKEYGEKISRNGFDHLIWYFHKGRN